MERHVVQVVILVRLVTGPKTDQVFYAPNRRVFI